MQLVLCYCSRVHGISSDTLLPAASRVSLVEFLALYRTAIVIDGAQALDTSWDDIAALLDTLRDAALFLINPQPRWILPTGQITLEALSHTEAMRLLDSLPIHLTADERLLIWTEAGGNPRKIYQIAGSLQEKR